MYELSQAYHRDTDVTGTQDIPLMLTPGAKGLNLVEPTAEMPILLLPVILFYAYLIICKFKFSQSLAIFGVNLEKN